MNEFAVFRRFTNREQAGELVELLGNNGIECKLVEDSPGVDVTFTGNTALQNEIQLMLRQSDFETANNLLEENAEALMNNVDPDYYLFEFSDEELYEILTKPDEWNSFDYMLAQKILKEKGRDISAAILQTYKNERIRELSRPDKGQGPWIALAYFMALFGGFLGLIIGWYLLTIKKTLPNGEKVYIYSDNDRKHGKRIFILGIILMPLELAWLVWYRISM